MGSLEQTGRSMWHSAGARSGGCSSYFQACPRFHPLEVMFPLYVSGHGVPETYLVVSTPTRHLPPSRLLLNRRRLNERYVREQHSSSCFPPSERQYSAATPSEHLRTELRNPAKGVNVAITGGTCPGPPVVQSHRIPTSSGGAIENYVPREIVQAEDWREVWHTLSA